MLPPLLSLSPKCHCFSLILVGSLQVVFELNPLDPSHRTLEYQRPKALRFTVSRWRVPEIESCDLWGECEDLAKHSTLINVFTCMPTQVDCLTLGHRVNACLRLLDHAIEKLLRRLRERPFVVNGAAIFANDRKPGVDVVDCRPRSRTYLTA